MELAHFKYLLVAKVFRLVAGNRTTGVKSRKTPDQDKPPLVMGWLALAVPRVLPITF
jgi:hypothetical protein